MLQKLLKCLSCRRNTALIGSSICPFNWRSNCPFSHATPPLIGPSSFLSSCSSSAALTLTQMHLLEHTIGCDTHFLCNINTWNTGAKPGASFYHPHLHIKPQGGSPLLLLHALIHWDIICFIPMEETTEKIFDEHIASCDLKPIILHLKWGKFTYFHWTFTCL